MTENAVDPAVEPERLDLGGGAWIDITRGWLAQPDDVFAHLRADVPWQSSRLFRYDHFVEENRLGASWRRGRRRRSARSRTRLA